jgi:SAM-dependent methyltransferase
MNAMSKKDVYRYPRYYEIAFSFVDPVKQVDLFEKFIRKYSHIEVKRFLDIGCGPGLQLREIARRGYEAVGLDSSAQMLTYLRGRAKEMAVEINTVKADMNDFRMRQKVDFAFIMMGTIVYANTNTKLLRHLDSVAKVLKSGGLYLIENFRLDWSDKDLFGPCGWYMKRDGVSVDAVFDVQLNDTLKQTVTETLTLSVEDHGRNHRIDETLNSKIIFPQEFLTLVKLNGKFAFVGWFERHAVRKLKKASMDNIVILRRK